MNLGEMISWQCVRRLEDASRLPGSQNVEQQMTGYDQQGFDDKDLLYSPSGDRQQEMMVLNSWKSLMLAYQLLAWVLLACLEQCCLRKLCGFGKNTFGGMEKALCNISTEGLRVRYVMVLSMMRSLMSRRNED